MDGPLTFAQGPGITAGQRCLRFGQNRERDFVGAVGAQIQTDRSMQAQAHPGRDRKPAGLHLRQNPIRAFPGAEQAEVGEGAWQQAAEQGNIMEVMVRHDDRHGIRLRVDPGDRFFGAGNQGDIGFRKPLRSCRSRARIDDAHVPAEGFCESYQRPGVVACPEDHK